MLVQEQTRLRLNVEQILAAISLLSDEEKTILQQSTPFFDVSQVDEVRESQQAHLDTDQTEMWQAKTNKGKGIDSWSAFLANIEEVAVDTGIEDLSINHDHYLYGLPKRSLT